MKNSKGFTLIEILIVIVIMGMFLTIGVARYRDFARRQEVAIAKRDIIADMREAQKNSISGNKPQGCTGNLVGYAFEVTSSNPATYTITVLCTNLAGGADLEFPVKEANLASTISITTPSTNPIIFRPFTLGTNIPSPNVETIDISSAGAENIRQVSVRYSGEIE